jgi:hypothetical protein
MKLIEKMLFGFGFFGGFEKMSDCLSVCAQLLCVAFRLLFAAR